MYLFNVFPFIVVFAYKNKRTGEKFNGIPDTVKGKD